MKIGNKILNGEVKEPLKAKAKKSKKVIASKTTLPEDGFSPCEDSSETQSEVRLSKAALEVKWDMSFLKSLEDSDIWGNRYYYRPYAQVPRTNRVSKALLGKTKFAKISFEEAGEKIMAGVPVTLRMKRKIVHTSSRIIEPGLSNTPLDKDLIIDSPEKLHDFTIKSPDVLHAVSCRYMFNKMNDLRARGKIRPGVVPAVVHTNDGRAIDTKTGKYIDPK